MKKSKIITIGLLALSLAGCSDKNKDKANDWDGSLYVSSDGQNYQETNTNFPTFLYWYLFMNSNGSYSYRPGTTYYYHASRSVTPRIVTNEAGHFYSGNSARGFSSRGGFGSIGGRSCAS